MALGSVISSLEMLEFRLKFTEILDEFHQELFQKGYEVYVSNFSCLDDNYINLHIYYICNDGKPVQIETMGQVDH